MRKKCMFWFLSMIFLASSIFAQTTFTEQGHPRPDLENKTQSLNSKKKLTKSEEEMFDYSKFTFDSIKFWVGEGENKAALVIDWYDNKGPSMVWGFRWHKDSTATGETMLRAVAAADPKFSALIMGGTQYGSAVAGLGYDPSGTGEMCVKYNDDEEDIHCPDEYGIIYTSSYDFDNFNYPVNLDFRWFSAWMSFGYWSYQLKGEGQDEFTYAPVGASSRILSDGDWDGWGAQVGWESMNGVKPRMPFMAAPLPPVSAVKLNYNVKGVEPTQSFQLVANVLPLYTENKNVLWSSADESIASVATNGLVTGNAQGETYIIVTTEEGNFKDSCKVIVKTLVPFPDYTAYWPEMAKDSSHLAIVDQKLARKSEEFSEKWKIELVTSGFINGAQPIIVDDYVFVAHNSKLKKIDRSTGDVVKESSLGGSCGFFSMIAYGEGKIFVPMNNGLLQAFNAETLEPIWKIQTPGYQHINQVIYYDGYVYTGYWKGIADGAYYCVSATDEDPFREDEEKEYVWKTTECGFYWSGGTIVDDAIIFGGDNGILQSRNRLTGEILDTLKIAPELSSSTIRCGTSYDAATQRIFFTGKEAKKLYGVKIKEGGIFDKETILSQTIAGQSTTTPAVYNGRIYASSGTMTSGGGLDVFDANTLEKIYSVDMGGISQATPLLATGYATEENRNTVYIYLTLNNISGSIVCIKDFEGNTEPLIQFSYTPSTTQFCTQSLIADEDGIIYYRNDSKYFFAFESTPTLEEEPFIALNPKRISNDKTTHQLEAITIPKTAAVSWSSRDESIVSVDDAGLVTIKKEGKAYIIATMDGENLSDSCYFVSKYNINTIIGEGGEISTVGSNIVEYGDSKTFSIIPNKGYEILDVLINGVSIGKANEYTFYNVIGDSIIEAVFAPILPVSLPYVCEFENNTENSRWVSVYSGNNDRWVTGNKTNNGGENAMYVAKVNGDYSYSSTRNFANIYRDITFTNDKEFILTFDWKCTGEGDQDNVQVFLIDTDMEVTAAACPDSTLIGKSFYSGNAEWSSDTITLDGEKYAGKTKRLVFQWKTNNKTSTPPPGAIDNISIIVSPQLSDLIVSNVNDTSAVINWHTPSNVQSVTLEYRDKTATDWIIKENVTSPYALNSLNYNTEYEVRVKSIWGNEKSTGYISEEFITIIYNVESVALNTKEQTINQGDTYQLIATILPENAHNKNVSWTSASPEIAAVDQNGLITAFTHGNTKIIVTTKDGGFSDTCYVEVPFVEMTNLVLNRNTDTLYIGVKEQLAAEFLPEKTSSQTLFWESSNSEIATVNSTGLVTALTLGKVVIYVSNEEETLKDSCVISIQEVDYTKGTFFVNEDWFGHNNSTVNFLTSNGKWIYRAFQRENPGKELGATSQFGTIYGDKFYIISKQDQDPGANVQGSRLAVCDAKTMKCLKEFPFIATNENDKSIADGRSFLGVDEHKGYIGTSNGIWIYDIDNMTIKGQIESTGSADGGLYNHQIGNMIRVDNHVFAIHQKKGVLIIDAMEDIVKDSIGGRYGSIVLSKDGNLWLSVVTESGNSQAKLIKLNPYLLDTTHIELPKGTGIPNSWYAWTADGFCASNQENKLYWKNDGGWFAATKIFSYDIESNTTEEVYDFSGSGWGIYGAGFRIHLETDEIYCSLFKSFGDNSYKTVRISTTGELMEEYVMEKNYWFPAMPVFPDNHIPEISEEINSIIELEVNESIAIYLGDKITDADNFNPAIIKRVSVLDGKDLVEVSIQADTLHIKMLDKGIAAIQLTGNSNGKVVTKEIRAGKEKQGITTSGDKSISVYPNPTTSYVNITSSIGDRIIILDPMGRKIKEVKAASVTTQVDLSQYAKGVYLINIEGIVVKVIKQ